jgi:hypothetical protein
MDSRKYKILCDGQFIGFIFISDKNPKFPNCIVATIWPFEKRGNWTLGDLELVGQRNITDIYSLGTFDEEIQDDLLQRANINRQSCNNFQIVSY